VLISIKQRSNPTICLANPNTKEKFHQIPPYAVAVPMPAPKGTPLAAHEKGVTGKGADVWKHVKKCSERSPGKKNTHVCIYPGIFPEDGPGAVARPCGDLVTCACNATSYVTAGAVNHMLKCHPDSDIAKAERNRRDGKVESIAENVKMLADAGGSSLLPYSTTPAGRAEAATAMRTSTACFIIYANMAMLVLDSRYYRENLSTHIKFTGGDPSLAPVTTRHNVKEYITAEWKRKCTPALPFPSFPPL
jgi:hypothetical protein